MTQIRIDCPEELEGRQSSVALVELAQQAFLVRLYQLGQLSSGRAAEILHLSRREFLDVLSAYGVSMFDGDTDLVAEARIRH